MTMEAQSNRKNWVAWLTIPVLIVALCLIFPQWKRHDRFPYQGRWVVRSADGGKTFRSSISFDAQGVCAMDYSTGNGDYVQTGVPCSYEMGDKSALIRYQFKNLQMADGGVASTSYVARLTPENDGETLVLWLTEAEMIERGGEASRTQKLLNLDKTPVKFHRQ